MDSIGLFDVESSDHRIVLHICDDQKKSCQGFTFQILARQLRLRQLLRLSLASGSILHWLCGFWFLVTCQVRGCQRSDPGNRFSNVDFRDAMQRMVSHDPCNYTTCNTCTLPPSWEKRRVWQSRTVSRQIYRSMCVYMYMYILFCRTSGRVTPLYLHIFAPRAPINVFVGVGATDRATCVLSTEHESAELQSRLEKFWISSTG